MRTYITLPLCSLVMFAGLAAGVSAQAVKPDDSKPAIPWFETEAMQAVPEKSFLHAEHSCRGTPMQITNDHNGRLPAEHDNRARSMTLKGSQDTRVTVYNSREGKDDLAYAVIKKSDDEPVCVGTFESKKLAGWERHRGYDIWYVPREGEGLDGNVSFLQWGCWYC